MFCRNCGTQLPDDAKFCVSCGTALRQEAFAPTPTRPAPRPDPIPAPAANRNIIEKKSLSKKIMDFLLIPVGIILILLGLGHMALAVAGNTTTAQVTGSKQVMYVANDDSSRDPRRYQLDYQFSVKGERYTGSVTRIFEGGSQMRQALQVRYLPFWPHVNDEDNKGNPLGGLGMIGLGTLLLSVEIRQKKRRKG